MLKEECKTCPDKDKCDELMSEFTQAFDEAELISSSFNKMMSLAVENTSKLGLLAASMLMAARLATTIGWISKGFPEGLVAILDKYIDEVAAEEKVEAAAGTSFEEVMKL